MNQPVAVHSEPVTLEQTLDVLRGALASTEVIITDLSDKLSPVTLRTTPPEQKSECKTAEPERCQASQAVMELVMSVRTQNARLQELIVTNQL